MSTRIAILRGINVGGRRKILMADLISLLEKMNFSNVHTYIQSGNVIFDSKTEIDNLEVSRKIEKAIHKEFGFDVPVIVRTPQELEMAINKNPFYKVGNKMEHLHVTFLNEYPTEENQQKLASYDYKPDKFVIKEKNVFIHCEGKYHQSKLTNHFFEKKLYVSATTRNWKTVLKLLELSKPNEYESS